MGANSRQSSGGVEKPGSGAPTSVQGPDETGDGHIGMSTDPGTATTTVQVRAERSGKGTGRVYTIPVTCMDMGGTSMESSSQTVDATVTVPHDQR